MFKPRFTENKRGEKSTNPNADLVPIQKKKPRKKRESRKERHKKKESKKSRKKK